VSEGFTTVRVFDAPRERVWREWTEPEAFADWFGGAAIQVPLSTVSIDLREGGRLRATMVQGSLEINWKGEFQEVVEPERLVFTISDQPGEDRYELVIVELRDLGDGRTEMRFEQRGQMAAAEYLRAQRGWGKFFDRMAERLAGTNGEH
jgi:uncharacterized protein YndB with AHSA1/START domain